MMMEKKKYLSSIVKGISALFCMLLLLFGVSSMIALAQDREIEVSGNVYEFEEDSYYEFHKSDTFTASEERDTYGTFFIHGDIANVGMRDGVPSYEVPDGNLTFFYNYGDALLYADIDSWHLTDDKSKKVADITLDSNIMKGAMILQTSKDRKTWINADVITNVFGDTPIQTGSIYSTNDIQLINGCFYRLIIVYKLEIRTEEDSILFINRDKYERKKCAEVYEFYAYTDCGEADKIDLNQTYSLGSRVRVEKFDGYSGSKTIDEGDPHYGWDLGHFFVSGYTDKLANEDGDMIFLKNAGDKVVLWFQLKEDINHLQGDGKLSITADREGYDQYFETPRMDFGRGMLIIRYTDYNNVSSEPVFYMNYLEANASVEADTKVQLFEEGDYEVALDYEITKDKWMDKKGHYRIFFKFSVRNGNCMAYLFDTGTGNELSDGSITENGFRLDLAMSRYLRVNVKKEILKDSADGLKEDARFNAPTKDGAEYTEEGIYTIEVYNEYTNQSTKKKIYVGTNSVLRAHMATGLSISEINELLAQGATISEDGAIHLAVRATPTPQLPDEQEMPAPASDEKEEEGNPADGKENPDITESVQAAGESEIPTENASDAKMPVLAVAVVIVIACITVFGIIIHKK